jgi:hypothetical protein
MAILSNVWTWGRWRCTDAAVGLGRRTRAPRLKARALAAAVGLTAVGLVPAPRLVAQGAVQGSGRETGAHLDFPWPVKTREHIDLWLHGFAMIEDDTSQVPLFQRGYRDDITVLKNKADVLTKLDSTRDQLRARFALNPNLRNAQFLALELGTWDELRQVVAAFLKAEGNPAHAGKQATMVARLATYFPSAADRDWLRLFVESLEDERLRWYHSYWVGEQRKRNTTLDAVDSTWQHFDRPQLQRFLNNTQEQTGDFVLSLPLDGEGRMAQLSTPTRMIVIATPFPASPDHAVEAIYVFAHEAVAAVVGPAIVDNITPAERRMGLADRYGGPAAVRGGLMLLQRAAPELVDGYCRYYLQAANVPLSTTEVPGALPALLAQSFPLPDVVRDAIGKQLDVVIGGI